VAVVAAVALAALDAAPVGPALIVRVTGAPGFAGVPEVGFVRMAVLGVLRLVSVSIAATSKPAPEMVLTASSRLWPDTSGIAVCSSSPGSPAATTAFGASGRSAVGIGGAEDLLLIPALGVCCRLGA
jgi:hypothetical protein